ncbi:C-GCAxxG-C-C family protein [Thermodesulfobacteriota bacterium]
MFRQRAENLFSARKLCCAEALLYLMNRGFRGELPPDAAIRIGTGFCHGMGNAEHVCGAVTGGIMALGLFLGPGSRANMKKKQLWSVIKELTDRFQHLQNSTSCDILLLDAKENKISKSENCMDLTGLGAEITVDILLRERPQLKDQLDLSFLNERESKLSGLIKRLI